MSSYFAFLLGLLLAFGQSQGHAQARPMPLPDSAAFFTQWRDALARTDREALADLTQLPFLFEGRSENRQGFTTRVQPALFTARTRSCLQKAKPVREDDRLVLWCQPYGFYFGVVGGQWRLIEFATDAP